MEERVRGWARFKKNKTQRICPQHIQSPFSLTRTRLLDPPTVDNARDGAWRMPGDVMATHAWDTHWSGGSRGGCSSSLRTGSRMEAVWGGPGVAVGVVELRLYGNQPPVLRGRPLNDRHVESEPEFPAAAEWRIPPCRIRHAGLGLELPQLRGLKKRSRQHPRMVVRRQSADGRGGSPRICSPRVITGKRLGFAKRLFAAAGTQRGTSPGTESMGEVRPVRRDHQPAQPFPAVLLARFHTERECPSHGLGPPDEIIAGHEAAGL